MYSKDLYFILIILGGLGLAWVVVRYILKRRLTNIEVNGAEIIQNITALQSNLISSTFIRINALYSNIIRDLAVQDYQLLQKNEKKLKTLNADIEILRNAIFKEIIANSDDKKVNSFYVLTIENMEDMVLTLSQILKISKSHIYKNRKKLTFNQIKDLKIIDEKSSHLLHQIEINFSEQNLQNFEARCEECDNLLILMNDMLSKHIERIKSTDYNPKNFKLYTKFLRKSINLIKQLNDILVRLKEA